MSYKILQGNMLDLLEDLKDNSIDSIITDPPYELNFMGKDWDNAGVSFSKATWEKCLRVLKPGGHMLVFGGSRTFHRIACAIEDAGFDLRDTIMWLYGSGFPKNMNIGLAIDKVNGVESEVVGTGRSGVSSHAYQSEETTTAGEYEIKRAKNQWGGWGTCLKPSFEPIIVARKPFSGSLTDNVLKNGVGGFNLDECRVGNDVHTVNINDFSNQHGNQFGNGMAIPKLGEKEVVGRYPANTILTYDETDYDEVCGGFPNSKGMSSQNLYTTSSKYGGNSLYESSTPRINGFQTGYNDDGSAARYFYCAKASTKDRDDGLEYMNTKTNNHPTVKPTELMQYLIRLVTPKGGLVLDPFMGSGSTGKATMYENNERDANYSFIGIELNQEYCKIAEARIIKAQGDILKENAQQELIIEKRKKAKKLF